MTTIDYHKIIEDIEDYAILLLDEKGLIKDWNKGAEKLKGYKAQEIIGKNFRVFYTEEDREKGLPEKLIKIAEQTGKAMDEGWRVRKDGSRFWGSILITALHDETNKLTGFLKITRDLTERKSIEEKLKQSNEEQKDLFVSIVNSSDDAIISKDLQGIVTSWNDGAKKVFGYTAEEILGKHISILIPPTLQEEEKRIMKSIAIGEVIDHYETERIRKDGEIIQVSLTISPIKDSQGKVVGASKISRDISERKIAEDKIIKANRLYAFLSAINQSIVHIHDEKQLIDNACKIAIEVGQFKTAFIGLLDENDKLDVAAIQGDEKPVKDILQYSGMNYAIPLLRNTPIGRALSSGNYALSNNVQDDPAFQLWKDNFSVQHGIKSSISLPLKKFGKVIGVFVFHSTVKDFFDPEEILLLREAASDISFALEIFEKEKLRRDAEMQLTQNEARLKKAQSIAHIGHWEHDIATDMSLWSEETCRIYGFEPDDNKQPFETWVSFIHPDDRDFVLKLIKEQRESLSNGAFDYRIIRKDGAVRHIHFESKFEFSASGRSIGLYGIVHDITEQKIAEHKLKESAARLNEAQAIAHVGSFEVDLVANILSWSDELFDILGYDKNEVAATNELFFSVIHPDDLSTVSAIFNEIMTTFVSSNTGFRLLSRDKAIKYIYCKWQFEFDHAHRPLRLYGIMQDITERKEAEQQIIKLNQELEARVNERTAELVEAYQQLESFSYTVSHDLRSPLQVIGGYADVLSKKHEQLLNPDALRLLSNIKGGVKQMAQLIEDLLNFSRLSRVELVRKPVDMKLLMQQVIEKLKLSDKNFKTGIELHALKTVNGDAGLLHQVCINLVSNAVKYSQKVEKPVVEIGCTKVNDEDVFYVKDNGAGFDMKYADKLFGAFQRLHNQSDFEGTGVGLALVHSIITKHGGRIWADSQPGKGATFYFTLPG